MDSIMALDGRRTLILFSVLTIVWVGGVTSLFIVDKDGLIALLESYLSIDGQLHNPTISLLKVTAAPVLLLVFIALFGATYRAFAYAPRHIPKYALFFVVHFVVYNINFRYFIRSGAHEDTLWEWATVFASLGAGLLFVYLGLRGLRFAFLLAAGWIFFGMEEMSWGQRILEIDSPEFFENYNHQQEITLHNFFNPILLYVSILMNAFLLCFFTWFRRIDLLDGFYDSPGVAKIVLVSEKYGLWTIPTFLIFASIYPGGEYVEEQWAMFGLILAILLLRKDPALRQTAR